MFDQWWQGLNWNQIEVLRAMGVIFPFECWQFMSHCLKGFKWGFSGNLPGFCWKNVGLTFSHFCTCTLKNACTEKALEVMQ